MSEPVPVGTRVVYHGRLHVVRGHARPGEHPFLTAEQVAGAYPDGVCYELWPEDVPHKFGERNKATYFVRRSSFEVLGEAAQS